MPVIPDSVNGAILLSVIDFFLSFVVISFIGFILAVFPYLNRLTAVIETKPPAVEVSVMSARDESAEHAAVIAAAVYAILGTRRIVHIGGARPSLSWTSQIRARLHTAHIPRIERR